MSFEFGESKMKTRTAYNLPDIPLHELTIIYMENIIHLLRKRELPDSIRVDGYKNAIANLKFCHKDVDDELHILLVSRFCNNNHSECISFWNYLMDKIKRGRFPTESEIDEAEFHMNKLSTCRIKVSDFLE